MEFFPLLLSEISLRSWNLCVFERVAARVEYGQFQKYLCEGATD
jgi:hypothetical protein